MEIILHLELLQMQFPVQRCPQQIPLLSLPRHQGILHQCLRTTSCTNSQSKRIVLLPHPRRRHLMLACLLPDLHPSSVGKHSTTTTLPARYQHHPSTRQRRGIPAVVAQPPTWDGQEHKPRTARLWRSNRLFLKAIPAAYIVLRRRLEGGRHRLGEVAASEDLGNGLTPVMLWGAMSQTWKVTTMIYLVNLKCRTRRVIPPITISLLPSPMFGLRQLLIPVLILLR